jgi:hypothetical protein
MVITTLRLVAMRFLEGTVILDQGISRAQHRLLVDTSGAREVIFPIFFPIFLARFMARGQSRQNYVHNSTAGLDGSFTMLGSIRRLQ